ncbi:MAG: bifunctional protein-serine/threonine kinase/phosphatase [Hahellaceae bacterium]|nr:bifunctional protein-serine/threonine kinase/phosphatase [Hahellaceae bacterium]
MHLNSSIKVSTAQFSDKGVKPQNEDCIGIRVPEQPALTVKGLAAVIADGVSSAEAGKEASETCVKNFLYDYFSTPDSWSVQTSAQKVLTALNRWLYGQGQQYLDAHRGYISTLSVLVIKSCVAHIFHIGDSRIYRLREGQFEQLTRDHCAFVSSDKAYLTRAMGMDLRLDVDYRSEPVEAGDLYLTTTDGIHDFIDRRELEAIVRSAQQANEGDNLQGICERLAEVALSKGSDDNISCQLIRIDELPDANADDVYHKLSDLPFPPFLEAGMILDGYRIIREIHASSRSQLYLVEDVASGTRLAMKTPSVNFEDDPAYIERFILEEWVGKRVDSEHVVKVVVQDRPRSCLYYLCEFVDGQTLADWMRDNPRPDIKTAIAILNQVVKGVRALHRKETLHQDLKPDNLVMTSEGVVKLIDFGSCLVAGLAEIDTPFERDMALGTATYSAPEQHLRRKSTVQSDLFSVAVIFYEMLTGRLPYGDAYEKGKSMQDFSRLTYQHAYQFNPMLPVWMDGALRKALQMSPELRYDSFSEFVFDLEHPNKAFMQTVRQPLLERNPIRFWQITSALLLVAEAVTLWAWLGHGGVS